MGNTSFMIHLLSIDIKKGYSIEGTRASGHVFSNVCFSSWFWIDAAYSNWLVCKTLENWVFGWSIVCLFAPDKAQVLT